jgi:hypothetical protein
LNLLHNRVPLNAAALRRLRSHADQIRALSRARSEQRARQILSYWRFHPLRASHRYCRRVNRWPSEKVTVQFWMLPLLLLIFAAVEHTCLGGLEEAKNLGSK